MTGHAFQCLISDEELRTSLAAIHAALVTGGVFAFETRNPAARAWRKWASGDPIEVVDPAGRALLMTYDVLAVEGDVVTLTETTRDADGRALRVDEGSLRFLDADALADFLREAGFVIAAQYGGWSQEALTASSAEIVTLAQVAEPRRTWPIGNDKRRRPLVSDFHAVGADAHVTPLLWGGWSIRQPSRRRRGEDDLMLQIVTRLAAASLDAIDHGSDRRARAAERRLEVVLPEARIEAAMRYTQCQQAAAAARP